MNCPSCGSDAQKKVGNGRFQCKECKRYYRPSTAIVPNSRLEVLKQVITDGIEKFIEVGQALKRYGIRDCTRKMATTDLKILPG